MDKLNMYAGVVYQFLVLLAIIIFNGYFIIVTGKVNEILLGALIGVMATLPFKNESLTKPKIKDKL